SAVLGSRTVSAEALSAMSRTHGLPPHRGGCPAELRRADESVGEREEHELGPCIETELAHDVRAGRVDGPHRDGQLPADLVIRVPEREQLEDVALALREILQGGRDLVHDERRAEVRVDVP